MTGFLSDGSRRYGVTDTTTPLGASMGFTGRLWDTGAELGLSIVATVLADQPGQIWLVQSPDNATIWLSLVSVATVAGQPCNCSAPVTMRYAMATFLNTGAAQTAFVLASGLRPTDPATGY